MNETASAGRKDKYHHGDLRAALISAGLEVLKVSGYQGLSLRAVAKKAGVSHTAPCNHFRDRDDLYAAIAEEGFRLLISRIKADLPAEVQRIKDLEIPFLTYLDFARENPDMYTVMFSREIDFQTHTGLEEISQEAIYLLEEIVALAQETGIEKPGGSSLMALFIWTFLHGHAELLLNRKYPKEQKGEISDSSAFSNPEGVKPLLAYLLGGVRQSH